MMEAELEETSSFQLLPPEMVATIFNYLDMESLTSNRLVCKSWNVLIEALNNIYLEMDNSNWECFLTNCTAPRLHVHARALTYPIYLTSNFPNFASRLRHWEFSGATPIHNIVNILQGIKKLKSLAFYNIQLDNYGPVSYPPNYQENLLPVKILNIYPDPRRAFHVDTSSMVIITEILNKLLQPNTIIRLNLSSVYSTESTISGIFTNILNFDFEEEDPAHKYSNICKIVNSHSKSLQKIKFDYRLTHGASKLYLQFHQPLLLNQEGLRIHSSCLFTNTKNYNNNLNIDQLSIMDVLTLYTNQSNMENIKVIFQNDITLLHIDDIITNNSNTLNDIEIHSVESIGDGFRIFDSLIFSKCLNLKNLKLKTYAIFKYNKLINLDRIPQSLTWLYLAGFIPTFFSSKNGDIGVSQLKNLKYLHLNHHPWYYIDNISVTVMTIDSFKALLVVLPNLTKLCLVSIIPPRFITPTTCQILGLEGIENPVSPEFIFWCQHGGGQQGQRLTIKQRPVTDRDKIRYSIAIKQQK